MTQKELVQRIEIATKVICSFISNSNLDNIEIMSNGKKILAKDFLIEIGFHTADNIIYYNKHNEPEKR
jgi:hypothetical protein